MTLIEVVIATFIFAVIVLAVAGLAARSSRPAAVQERRGQAVVTAQTGLERISDMIRTAQDCGPDQLWVEVASATALRFCSNVDADPALERVELTRAGSLIRISIDGGARRTLVAGLTSSSPALFEYYTLGGALGDDALLPLTPSGTNLGLITRVAVNLAIDPGGLSGPTEPVRVRTLVTPRSRPGSVAVGPPGPAPLPTPQPLPSPSTTPTVIPTVGPLPTPTTTAVPPPGGPTPTAALPPTAGPTPTTAAPLILDLSATTETTVTEGDRPEENVQARLRLQLRSGRVAPGNMNVRLQGADGSAWYGSDYTTPGGRSGGTFSVILPAGQSGVDVWIDIVEDTIVETPPTEQFLVQIDSVVSSSTVSLGNNTATITIVDDDAAGGSGPTPAVPTPSPSGFLTIACDSYDTQGFLIREGNSGTTPLPIYLYYPGLTQPLTFRLQSQVVPQHLRSPFTSYASANDFQPLNEVVTLYPDGSYEPETLQVFVNGDRRPEGNEMFWLTTSEASGVTGDATGVCRIYDDD